MRFRKKPVEVEAIQWTGKNTREVKAWISEQIGDLDNIAVFVQRRSQNMTETLWGNVADPDWGKEVTAALWVQANTTYLPLTTGEWVMHDQFGFYPCKDGGDGAPMNYEPVWHDETLPVPTPDRGGCGACGRVRPCGGPHDCAAM